MESDWRFGPWAVGLESYKPFGGASPDQRIDMVASVNPPLIILGATYTLLIRLVGSDGDWLWLGTRDIWGFGHPDRFVALNPPGVFPYGYVVRPDDAHFW